MIRRSVLLFCAVFLVGCTILKTTPVIPERVEVFKPYPTGEVIEKSAGEQMMGYNLLLTAKVSPGFVAVEDFQPPAIGPGQNLPPIKAGSEWKAISKTNEGSYLCKNTRESYRALIGFTQPTTLSEWEVCLLVNSSNEPYGTTTCSPFESFEHFAFVWMQKPANFLQPKRIIEKREDIWREALIIYVGKTKDSIRFLYQETALKDLEFTFDLSESNTVSIKDITFEIIEATNNFIKFKIKTSPDELKSKIEKREKEKKLLGA